MEAKYDAKSLEQKLHFMRMMFIATIFSFQNSDEMLVSLKSQQQQQKNIIFFNKTYIMGTITVTLTRMCTIPYGEIENKIS